MSQHRHSRGAAVATVVPACTLAETQSVMQIVIQFSVLTTDRV
jgi:hypothetical protein